MNKFEPRIDQPAEYEICVVGMLDDSWSDRLGGLAIMCSNGGKKDEKPVTTLTGPLIDQAALFGVLNALYDMRLPLISVDCLSTL